MAGCIIASFQFTVIMLGRMTMLGLFTFLILAALHPETSECLTMHYHAYTNIMTMVLVEFQSINCCPFLLIYHTPLLYMQWLRHIFVMMILLVQILSVFN